MAIAVGDILRVAARMRLSGVSDIINVYHLSVAINTAVDDSGFMDELALSMEALYNTVLIDISPLVTFQTIEGFNVTQNLLLPSKPWPTIVAGTNSGAMLPEMNAACVFHRTLTPRVRAAKFLPPFGENVQTDGALDAAALAAVQTFGDFLTLGFVGPNIDAKYVAFNRLLGTATSVVQAIVPVRFRTQRGRRLGVGS